MKVNLHTHTVFCDGENTAEEMVLSAIDKGFDVLGFSGHSYTAFDESYCMSREGTCAYRNEIAGLKKKYAGRIEILCGIEQDIYSGMREPGYDYAIGSVHAVRKETPEGVKYLYVDWSAEDTARAVDQVYDGDALAFAEDYFAEVSRVHDVTGCDIIGHFDLITKFNEQTPIFDTKAPRYEAAVDRALEALLKKPVIFEINTGAISKNYRTTPYPSEDILKKISAGGGRIMINSDSHRTDTIDAAFDEAKALARACGFTELTVPDMRGETLWSSTRF